MKKIYSCLIILSSLFFADNLIAQPGWTIYNSSNSTLVSGTYRALDIDQSGNIWAGGSYSGLFKFNGSAWTRYSTINTNLLHDDIQDILVDNSQKVWTANYKGVSVFDGSTFTNYDTNNAAFNGMTVYALGKDNNGVIWLSSTNGSFGYQGITTFDGSTWTNLTGYPTQVAGGEFGDFAFTPSNEAWIASGTGITKYASTFAFYPKAVTGLWSSSSVAVDASGTIWAGGFDGLLKYDGSTWTMYDNVVDLGLTSNTLYYDILVDGNYLWIATSSGLLKFNKSTGSIVENFNSTNSPLATNGVTKIAKDASGNIWLAATIGIVKMEPAIVGVKEIKGINTATASPNPSNGIFNFTFGNADDIMYKIFSVDGSIILAGMLDVDNSRIDLTREACGIYFIQITDGASFNQMIKIVKYE